MAGGKGGAAAGCGGKGPERSIADVRAEADGVDGSGGKSGATCGEVVKLDRKFPLVELACGERIRCEHSAELKKRGKTRAVIGDVVEVSVPAGHDVGIIEAIRPRSSQFVRKDPTERALPQVLAANFDRVIVVQPIDRLNMKRLERELVLAHETGADVAVALTKADLLSGAEVADALQGVGELAGPSVEVVAVSKDDVETVARVRSLVGEGTTSVFIGRSGAGKSTLVNLLVGEEARATSEVRASDGKGRHKTVSREIMRLPMVDGLGGGRIVDMPGVRGLGLWDADEGIGAAFSDIEELALGCRFRDCKHDREPGCAVRAAVEDGRISRSRLDSYLGLQGELAKTARRREQAGWKNR